MKLVKVVHNAGAGAGAERYSREELLSLLRAEGYECRYSSTDDSTWNTIEPGTELIIVAGGDGTVRKVAGWMQGKPVNERLPVAVLPFGTANNIARTLGINGDIHTLIKKLARGRKKKFDIGRIYGVGECDFFLESVGCGVFPRLMEEMEKQDEAQTDRPEKRMTTAFQLLHRIIPSFETALCTVELNNEIHTGRFLLVEILNIPSIGPNLILSHHADPGDGELEVVLVPESDRDLLADYVIHKMNGTPTSFSLQTMRTKSIVMQYGGPSFHVDDKIINADENIPIRIEVEQGGLEFIVPDPSR